MLTIGLNLGSSYFNKDLKDGSVCIMEDENVLVAIAEERLSRRKHDGGFQRSLEYCLEYTNLKLQDVDSIIISSCCDFPQYREVPELMVEKDKVNFIDSHHLSHAYSAFIGSPFEQAIVVVMDGGGNVLQAMKSKEWWKYPREQNSYYIGEGTYLKLIGRDFDEPYETGFGEVYRYFTHYLGWSSSNYAGNTMALAAYGDSNVIKEPLFFVDNNKLRCLINNDPLKPIETLQKFLKGKGLTIKPREPNEEITQTHKDLARFVQDQIEEAIIWRINKLVKATGIKNICIAGGVGLNCLANTAIIERSFAENIFIQPACNDQGQSIGNAMYGYYISGNSNRMRLSHTYLGKKYDLDDFYYDTLNLEENLYVEKSVDIARDVAHLLTSGDIVGWFQGSSEFGPRALGNRSLLADPRYIVSKTKLDKIKGHEGFRPYAPSVLKERASDFFQTDYANPYMLLVEKVRPEKSFLIPAVLHVDGTARIQSVDRDTNELYYDLIKKFDEITGIPMILNTSFNGRGEPIVETPADALKFFNEQSIDVLAIGSYLVRKRV